MLLAIILKVFQKEETKGFLNMSFNIAFGEWLEKKRSALDEYCHIYVKVSAS